MCLLALILVFWVPFDVLWLLCVLLWCVLVLLVSGSAGVLGSTGFWFC